MRELRPVLGTRILVADGSTGVALARLLEEETGRSAFPDGCPEALVLSHPHLVRTLHEAYLGAGADIVLTNTFGANPLTLEPFGLAPRSEVVNRNAAALAREAVQRRGHGWVLGSIGPGSFLPSLGQSSFDELRASYLTQVRALLEGGVDGFVIETCQDPLQAKAAAAALREAVPCKGEGPLLVISLSLTEEGRMLLGTTAEAALATLLPFGPDLIGLNCGIGPREVAPALASMAACAPVPLWLKPNAGVPTIEGGREVFPLGHEEFARLVLALVERHPVAVVGGCCGTTPAHIRSLSSLLGTRIPTPVSGTWVPSLSSLYHRVTYRQEDTVLLVGERGNVNGSRKFRRAVEEGNLEEAVSIVLAQAREGAHAVDLCVDLVGEDPTGRLCELVRLLRARSEMPLVLDSASPSALVEAAKLLPGRGILNSVTFAEGEADFLRVAHSCLRTGCAMVVLAIDEEGQAVSKEHKLRVAHRADALRREVGLPDDALFFDPLVLPITSGTREAEKAASEMLEALEELQRTRPWMPTIAGISNVSHGLDPAPRRVLNTLLLRLASERGLTAAIVHAGQIEPLHRIHHELRAAGERLLREGAPRERLLAFLAHFRKETAPTREEAAVPSDVLGALEAAVVSGEKGALPSLITRGLATYRAEELLEQGLLRGMTRVGELFKAGQMQLPFVLSSAEVVREGSRLLSPHLGSAASRGRGSVVLATVEGDVHDIGKNLVGIILANNGFEVVDLGVRVPVVRAFQEAVHRGALALGLSGLLTQSVAVMRRGLEHLATFDGPHPPIIVGGAALTESYAARELAPLYPGVLLYGRDAVHGLELVRQLSEGCIPPRPRPSTRLAPAPNQPPILPQAPAPPPFLGARIRTDIPLEEIVPFLDRPLLMRRLWRVPPDETTEERLRGFLADFGAAGVTGAAAWGYWPARRAGDEELLLEDRSGGWRVMWVGRDAATGRSLAHYLPGAGGAIALFIVTMGNRPMAIAEEARTEGSYARYFLVHGLTMALVDALADLLRSSIVREWGIAPDTKSFSPGMPGFPELGAHGVFFDLLAPERIGVSHTETWQLVPECSASGLVLPDSHS